MNLDKVTPGLKSEIWPGPPRARTACLIAFPLRHRPVCSPVSAESYSMVHSLLLDLPLNLFWLFPSPATPAPSMCQAGNGVGRGQGASGQVRIGV